MAVIGLLGYALTLYLTYIWFGEKAYYIIGVFMISTAILLAAVWNNPKGKND